MRSLRVEYQARNPAVVFADVWRRNPLIELTGNGALRIMEVGEAGRYGVSALYSPRIWLRAVFDEEGEQAAVPRDASVPIKPGAPTWGIPPGLVYCPDCGLPGRMEEREGEIPIRPDGSSLPFYFKCRRCGSSFWR